LLRRARQTASLAATRDSAARDSAAGNSAAGATTSSPDQSLRWACWELLARCDRGLLDVATLNGADNETVLECRRQRIEVLGELASDARDRDKWRSELSRELLKLADHEWQLDRQSDAVREARRGWEALPEDRPGERHGNDSPSSIRERISVAGQFSNYLIETKSFSQARPTLERGLTWNRSLLQLPVVEFSDQQSLIRLERNLAFVEAQVGENGAARQRLTALGSLLAELLADRRFAQRSDSVDWATRQLQEVRSLLREP
jgi:hypothetical protein